MSLHLPIYLDYNATTPMDRRVLEAMMLYLTDEFGNAASNNHEYGYRAKAAVEKARQQVAALIGAEPKEIIFTSGATESDNLAIKGVAEARGERGEHLITCGTEHSAVLDTCKHLQKHGREVTYLQPDQFGRVVARQVAEALTDRTVLVTLMLANNEVGTLNPICEIAAAVKDRGALLHSDATQAVGKMPVNVNELGVDLLSISAHKLYGPKGVGAMYVRRGVRVLAQMHGGGHERNMRSGTLNVPGIVGLGAACEIAGREMAEEAKRVSALRDRLERGILARLDEVTLNGHPTERLANTSNLSFAYVEGEGLMMRMKDVAVSSGSACTSASLKPSHVLSAMGVPDELNHASLRFSLGRFSTEEEVDYTIEQVVRAARELRELSPLYEMARGGIDLNKVHWTEH